METTNTDKTIQVADINLENPSSSEVGFKNSGGGQLQMTL